MTTATLLAINLPLCALFLGAWSGIPLWMVFKHPDEKPEGAKALPACRRVPAAHRWSVDRLRLITE